MLAYILTRRAKNGIEASKLSAPIEKPENGVPVYKLSKPANFTGLQNIYFNAVYPHYISQAPAVYAIENPDRFFQSILSIPDPFPVACPLTAEKVIRHLKRLPRINDISKVKFPQAKELGPVDTGMRLDNEQAHAVAHYLGPALAIAPAGSGKTTTLTARVVALIKRGIKPERILCLTFTRKAAQEMQERLVMKFGELGRLVTIKTYHALAYQLISEFEGHAPNLISDRYKVLQELMFEDSFNYKISLEDADSFISLQMNDLIAPDMVRPDNDSQWQMKRLYQAYREYLEKNNIYDQDFLLVKLHEILRDNSKHRHALMDYTVAGLPAGYPKGRWQFVLVDECQDNNLAQDVLTRFFAAPWDNVFFVGDEDQLLYTFRGSDIKRILDLGKNYPCLKETFLKTNYRCRPGIVRAADRLIRKNVLRRDKEIVAFRDEAEGVVISKFFTSAGAEYEWIAQEIKALVDSGTKPGDIAVLYRINVQGDAVAMNLKDKDIPHYVHRDGKSLFQYCEVEALLNHLVLVLPEFRNTQEFKVALLKSLVVPKRTEKIAKYEELLKGLPVEFLPAVAKLAAELNDGEVQELCYQILNLNLLYMPNAGLTVSYVRQKFIESWYSSDSETERLDIIESIASKFKLAADFVNWVRKTRVLDNKRNNGAGEGIQLMTVHSAKGLEFPVVFLMNCTEGYFPYSSSLEEGNLEEERRIFYVGMTRAREILYLTGYADKKKRLSRFLLDAGVLKSQAALL